MCVINTFMKTKYTELFGTQVSGSKVRGLMCMPEQEATVVQSIEMKKQSSYEPPSDEGAATS